VGTLEKLRARTYALQASGRAGELGDDAEVPDEDAAQLSEEEEAAAPDSGDEEYDSDEERR